jgi:hypothetical protein
MKGQQIRGLRNKGTCTLAEIDAVAVKLCPYVRPNFTGEYMQRKEAARRRWREIANNPINNPQKKANLDALRAAWKKLNP